jgi:hypothetical protein
MGLKEIRHSSGKLTDGEARLTIIFKTRLKILTPLLESIQTVMQAS